MNLQALGGSIVAATKRNGPALLTTAGVAGFVATTVLVGRAVLKSQPTMHDLKVKTDHVSKKQVTDEYSEKDKAQEIGNIWVREAVVLARIYSPAIAVGSLSIFCFVASHGMMKKRQTALVAAYTALDQGFRAYRRRVEEELGADKERDIYRGIRRTENPDKSQGAPEWLIEYAQEGVPSPYARFFDELNPNWENTPEYNLFFLRSQQNYLNDKLRVNGFVFLNEAYQALGIPRTQAGQIVGWKYDSQIGDGHIDFGLYDIGDQAARAFINGLNDAILLDFNVDGPIEI